MRSRTQMVLRIVGGVLVALVMLSVGGFWVWAKDSYRATAGKLQEAEADTGVEIVDSGNAIELQRKGARSSTGFIFYPGAKVAPEAYVYKLSRLVSQSDVTVFISKPLLNLAFFGINDALAIESRNPGISTWYVGGHSLGGSMACLFAHNNPSKIRGIVLMGTYCGSDISALDLKVLSLNGTRDGIFPLDQIQAHRGELPKSAAMIQIEGMDHAEVGDYGPQAGDRDASISDDDASSQLVSHLEVFFK